MSDLFSRIVELKKQNKTFCIVTVVDSAGETPRKAGARGIVHPDSSIEGTVGGGSIEVEAVETAQKVLKAGKPLLKEYPLTDVKDGMACGGKMTLFYEPILPQRRVTIFGGGHVGRAISQAAHLAGWQVKVVDHRPEVLDSQFFHVNADLVAAEYPDYIKATSFNENDWIVIVTHKHKYDQDVVEQLIQHNVAYLGMMGSDTKVKQVMKNLKSKGIGDDRLSRVYAPIGLNIGTETPGEIAIAIVAEMMAVLNGITEVKSCRK